MLRLHVCDKYKYNKIEKQINNNINSESNDHLVHLLDLIYNVTKYEDYYKNNYKIYEFIEVLDQLANNSNLSIKTKSNEILENIYSNYN